MSSKKLLTIMGMADRREAGLEREDQADAREWLERGQRLASEGSQGRREIMWPKSAQGYWAGVGTRRGGRREKTRRGKPWSAREGESRSRHEKESRVGARRGGRGEKERAGSVRENGGACAYCLLFLKRNLDIFMSPAKGLSRNLHLLLPAQPMRTERNGR